jgi:hypothetical protein
VLFFWAVLISIFVSSLVWIAARTPVPLMDWRLAHIDNALGLETSFVVRWAILYPRLAAAMGAIYGWMIPFSLLALAFPVFRGQSQAPQRLVLGYTAAALITIAIFAVCPAVGPWSVYHFAATREQSLCQTTLALLKSGGRLRQDIVRCGLIAFPSFHVAQCVLTAISLWRSRWLRFPAVVLATLICLSTLTTGWHYVADVIAGVAVAIIAHVFAVCILRRYGSASSDTAL